MSTSKVPNSSCLSRALKGHHYREPLYALILVSFIGFSTFRTSAQQRHPLPDHLNEHSTLVEIVQWLDKTSFGNARIGLKDTWYDDDYIPPLSDYRPALHTFVFAPGFKVTNIEGCTIALKSDDARIISKSMKVEEPKGRVAHLNIELHRMSPSKGRSTYRHTKDPEKSHVLGAWRTEYKYKGISSKTFLGLHLYSSDSKTPANWIGYHLAFTFDSKEMSKDFDAAFRQAIRLCRTK